MVSIESSKQKLRSSAEMFPLMRSWEQSDLSPKDFCARHDMKPHIFWYWLRRYREKDQAASSQQNFIPIKMESGEEKSPFARIIYPDGTQLLIREQVDLKDLRSLLPKV